MLPLLDAGDQRYRDQPRDSSMTARTTGASSSNLGRDDRGGGSLSSVRNVVWVGSVFLRTHASRLNRTGGSVTSGSNSQARQAAAGTSAAPVQIRAARPADAPALGRLLTELGYPQAEAEVGGQVVGMASLHVTPFFNEGRSRGRITALVVDPDRRSRGIGRHLLTAVEAAARRRGCSAVELTSSAHRHGAHRFYLAAGYQDLPHRFFKQLNPAGDDHHGPQTPNTG